MNIDEMEAGPELDIAVGDRLRVFFGEGHGANCLRHVRGIVDGLYVVRRWSRMKQRWRYEVKDETFIRVYMDGDRMTIERRKRETIPSI